MSPTFVANTSAPVKIFRGVNGQRINLNERSDSDGDNKYQSRVVEFELRNESQPVNYFIDILILLTIVVLWNIIAHQLLITVFTVLYALLRCKSILSSVTTDTLLVVESVGVQIIRKRTISYFESTTFLPWNTVKDVIINEVITGNRVLYFLTFIVRDTSCDKDETKLVPLFRDLRPERKCLEYMYYHRNSRDTTEFNYGKELMKVIRRIIKSQPRQGQQFGTHHLLVTYNHSSWTRQDKMFAILKFRDRADANAFPSAFILTVKILNTAPTLNNVDGYDDELIVYKKNLDKSQWSDIDHTNSNSDVNSVSQETRNSSTTAADETSNDSTTRLTPINTTNINLSTANSIKYNERSKITNSASFFADLDNLPLLERYLLDQHDEPSRSPSSSSSSLSNRHQEHFNEMQETVDMPYQYLIEREIERTKKNITNNSIGETSSSRSRINSTNTIDNATAHSANITDLVMEGLMFTIRQDQDTVTVMEQRTKLEPDEVLENSEKAETKEGVECLLNSSLLKLENLITKIERSSGKSIDRPDDSCKAPLSISPYYTVGSNIPEHQQTTFDISKESSAIIKPCIFDYNTLKDGTFIAPKTLFKNHNDKWNNSKPSHEKLSMVSTHLIHNNTVNSNNNNNNINAVDAMDDSIAEPMEESKTDESIIKKCQQDFSNELDRENDTKSYTCNNDKLAKDEKVLSPVALHQVNSNKEINGTNLLINNADLKQSPNTINPSVSECKLKVPRIVSTEIVKYDLSSLRSSRLRRRLDSNEDYNKPTDNGEIRIETSSDIKTPIQKELTPMSNEEKINNETTHRRRLIAKRRLHGQKNDDEVNETTIEMWKFVRDMTYGVRVVLQRLDLSRIANGVGKNC
ncbi:hypothetical protein PV326_012743 [Microctonus aethiopoides]|nr:hypothetical protein PV326_012743 [Microctonus aethiopoides]